MTDETDTRDSDTTTGSGTTTGTGMNTVGGQSAGGPLTGGLAGNAVTTGDSGQGPPASGGRATPDFGPLARGSITGGGDSLDDAGGEDHNALPGNQDAATGDTGTGSMGVDTAALGGGVTAGGAQQGQSLTSVTESENV